MNRPLYILIYLINSIPRVPIFTGWPRAAGSYKGRLATITWTLSEPLTKYWYSVDI